VSWLERGSRTPRLWHLRDATPASATPASHSQTRVPLYTLSSSLFLSPLSHSLSFSWFPPLSITFSLTHWRVDFLDSRDQGFHCVFWRLRRVFSLSSWLSHFIGSTCIIHDLCCLELTLSLIVLNYYSITCQVLAWYVNTWHANTWHLSVSLDNCCVITWHSTYHLSLASYYDMTYHLLLEHINTWPVIITFTGILYLLSCITCSDLNLVLVILYYTYTVTWIYNTYVLLNSWSFYSCELLTT